MNRPQFVMDRPDVGFEKTTMQRSPYIRATGLLHGGGTLDEIAAQIGYKSASAFNTAFRQRVGCPPSEYARTCARDSGPRKFHGSRRQES
jgi:AraC-like DNA-binding protein